MTVYSFAVLLPVSGIFHRRAQRKAWMQEIAGLEGLFDVDQITRNILIIHMSTKNDVIIAKNRLAFVGVLVSEETHAINVYEETGHEKGNKSNA